MNLFSLCTGVFQQRASNLNELQNIAFGFVPFLGTTSVSANPRQRRAEEVLNRLQLLSDEVNEYLR